MRMAEKQEESNMNELDMDEQTSSLKYKRADSDEISVGELGEVCEALGLRLVTADMERIIHSIDEERNGVVKFDDFVRIFPLRIIESVRDTSFIDTRLTLASMLLGKDSALENWIFSTAVRQNTILGKVLWVMWYTGLIVVFPVMTVDLLKELFWHAEAWALTILQILWLCNIIRVLEDVRILFWICLMPSILVSAISDAYPAKYRARFQKLFFIGLLVAMAWWCVLVTFSGNDPITDHVWEFRNLHGSAVTNSVLNVVTAMFFAVRNLWSAVFRPQEFVIIVSATQTVHVQEADFVDKLAKFTRLSAQSHRLSSLVTPASTMKTNQTVTGPLFSAMSRLKNPAPRTLPNPAPVLKEALKGFGCECRLDYTEQGDSDHCASVAFSSAELPSAVPSAHGFKEDPRTPQSLGPNRNPIGFQPDFAFERQLETPALGVGGRGEDTCSENVVSNGSSEGSKDRNAMRRVSPS